jgi:hypothetical protein
MALGHDLPVFASQIAGIQEYTTKLVFEMEVSLIFAQAGLK